VFDYHMINSCLVGNCGSFLEKGVLY
jgi:hypothetical protein